MRREERYGSGAEKWSGKMRVGKTLALGGRGEEIEVHAVNAPREAWLQADTERYSF